MKKRSNDLATLRLPRAVQTALTAVSFTTALMISGCGIGRLTPSVGTGNGGSTSGTVHGGQQPVSGALIQLWAAGATGNASSASPLLTTDVFTDGGGGFGITGLYTCPSANTQVYVSATGGNPGLAGTVNNSSLALVALLGDCGTLATIPRISVNELTTVAAAYGMAPFATGVGNVGATATNLPGLRSAMQTAMLLASPYYGSAPADTLPLNATTETAKLVTLANVIASCVNSSGGVQCSSLAGDATTPGFGTPSDTFQMALMVAQHPGNNVNALFNDSPAQAAFGGSLAAPPSDWSMSIAYTGGGMGHPNGVAVDSGGNVWVSNTYGGVSAFTPQGSPLFTAGISAGMGLSRALSADASGSVWVANGAYDLLHPAGSVARIAADGTVLSSLLGYTAGGIDLPVAMAAAPNGNMIIADSGDSRLTVFSSAGNIISGFTGYGAGVLSQPSAVAVDAASNAWVANKGSGNLVQFDSVGNVLQQSACCGTPDSIVIDRNSFLWVGDSAAGTLTEVRSDGIVLQTLGITAALTSPKALAIDGSSHIFVADAGANGVAEIYDSSYASPGAQVGQTAVFGLDLAMQGPAGIAVDASGNVWISSRSDNRLINFIGMAAPLQTPRIALPVQP